tara:strand:+ start:484 stop:1014 length:531 start_codon:yes stop_codon:yes gene_type:complete
MNNYKILKFNYFIFILLFYFACEDNKTIYSDDTNNLEFKTITSGNVNDADFYFDLINVSIVDSISNWQLLIKTEGVYNMPSVFFKDEIKVAVYEDLIFEDILSFPETFEEDKEMDNSVFRYEGDHEILSYDITIHKVSVSNPSNIYIINDPELNKSFKLQFIEYLSGVTIFNYKEL